MLPIRPEVLAEYIQAIRNMDGKVFPQELLMLLTDALARVTASFVAEGTWTADAFLAELRKTVDHVYGQIPPATTHEDARHFLRNLDQMFVEYLAIYRSPQ